MSQGIAPARLAAFEILLKMESGAGHCDELLRTMRVQSLSPQDRNLCTNFVMGTLRWQIALDARVRGLLARPDVKLAAGVRVALRLGAYQLLHLDRVPAHAAISESVEIAKFGGEGFAAGMVNAVLRKIAVAGPLALPKSFRSAGEMASAFAHPAWMVERWVRRYGMERARKICEFDQGQAPVTLRMLGSAGAPLMRDGTSHEWGTRVYSDMQNTQSGVGEEGEAPCLKRETWGVPLVAKDGVVEELAAEGLKLADGAFLTAACSVVSGEVTLTQAYAEGRVRIQDEGSQLVAELAAGGGGFGRILDLCAAPGGKTAILAERNPGAAILACDVSGRRLEQMKRLLGSRSAAAENAGRIAYKTVDAADLRRDGEFDLVLCDVPCSGTGTLARNPEIRHRMTGESLVRHRARQIEILRAGMRAAAPGGRVVYATCSMEPEENEAVVEACLKGADGFRVAEFDLAGLVRGGMVLAEALETLRQTAFDGPYLRTVPGVHPCDGFFAALIVKGTA